jgi:PKD repeat protein
LHDPSSTVADGLKLRDDFSFTSDEITVVFYNISENATGWFWEFGDGTTSTDQNPSHTYDFPGSNTVCLMVSDNFGTNTFCEVINIIVTSDQPLVSGSITGELP